MSRCRMRPSLTIAFLAVALAGTPVLGDGLVSHLAGFKGATVQKVAAIQKGGIIQKGAIQKGGCAAGPRCGCGSVAKGGGCNSCCLLPAIVAGVGNLIEGIFRCDSCCRTGYGKGYIGKGGCAPAIRTRSCGCAPLQLLSRRCCGTSSCGCGGKGKAGAVTPARPADPFIEDSLAPAPVSIGREARVIRKAPIYQSATVVAKKETTPRTISVASARPLKKAPRPAEKKSSNVVVRANNAEELPQNPLRN